MRSSFLILLSLLHTVVVFSQPQQEYNTALLKKNKVKSLELCLVYPLDMINGTKGQLSKKIFFDREGRITKINLYNDSGKMYHTTRHEYNAKGLLAKQVTLYEEDTTIMHYTYSKHGVDTTVFSTGKGSITGMGINTRNGQGLVTCRRFTRNGETVQLDSMVYDRYGRKIQETNYNQDLSISTWTSLFYNEKGWLDVEDHFSGYNCKRSYRLKYIYDAHGNLITQKVVSDNVKITYPVNTYDEQNRLVREEYYSADSTRHDVKEWVWKDTLLEETTITFHHLPKTITSRYKYLAGGLQDETEVVSDEPRKEASEINVHNEKGELVETIHYTGDKKTYYIQYNYDEQGRRTEERHFADNKQQREELFVYTVDGKLASKKLIIPAIYAYTKGKSRHRDPARNVMDTTETLYMYKGDKLAAEYDHEVTREKPSCFLQYNSIRNIFPEEDHWGSQRCAFSLSVMDTLEQKKDAESETIKLKLRVRDGYNYEDSSGVCIRTIVIDKESMVITDTDLNGLELLRIVQKGGVYDIRKINTSYYYRPGIKIALHHVKHIGVAYDTLFFNKSGEKIKQVTQVLGGPLEHRTWKYKDKEVVKDSYSNSQGYKDGPNTYFYKLNEAGEKIEMRMYNAKGELGRIERYTWKNGKLVEKKNAYEPDKVVWRYGYEYY